MHSSRNIACNAGLLWLAFVTVLQAQDLSPVLRLKATATAADKEAAAGVQSQEAPKHWGTRDWHWLLEFKSLPMDWQRTELNRRGARILEFVPDSSLMVAAPEDTDFSGLDLVRASHLQTSQKMSPAIGPGQAWFLVEFHADVEDAVMRSIVLEEDLSFVENPDLLHGQLLVSGSAADMLRLAGWDEVEYIFPAAPELIEGRVSQSCPNALTALGRIGQITAVSGDGWDGPGKNAAELFYFFNSFTQKMNADVVRQEVQRAMAEWSKAVQVTFTRANTPNQPRQIDIMFARGEHGDGYAFDGPGKVLAHAFYPAPPNPESIAADLHLDDDESWQQGGSLDLFSVVLHELGHSLGLGHSDSPGAVMYPYYKKATSLAQEDIDTVRQLYAARDTAPSLPGPLVLKPLPPPANIAAATVLLSGTAEGGKGNVKVMWSSDRGSSGEAVGGRNWTIAALPLEMGLNGITIMAVDDAGASATANVTVTRVAAASPAPLTIRIQTPQTSGTVETSASTLEVTGIASHPSGIARVTWATTTGASGRASGTNAWSTGAVPLTRGFNRILVTAADNTGQLSTVFLDVNYQPGVDDTTPPSVTILYPDNSNFQTSAAEITLAGSAYDNTEVRQVSWATSSGRNGIATGTTHWSAGPITLPVGTTAIVIRAVDRAGNIGWQSVVVTRR